MTKHPRRRSPFPFACVLVALALGACDGEEPSPTDGGVEPDAASPPPTYALRAPVEVHRDSMGMVHIYAENDEDLFYGSGYMQAVDRLLAMDLTRRRAVGRRAEVLGERYVDDDQLVRVVGLERWGRAGAELMREEHPDEYALMVAWTAGVNARIEEVLAGEAPVPYGFGPDELDYDPEPWAVADAFVVAKLVLFGNANQLEFDLLATVMRDLLPDTFAAVPLMQPLVDAYVLTPEERPGSASEPVRAAPPAHPRPTLPPGAADGLRRLFDLVPEPTARFSSNNWAVDGRHTADGRPLLAGDPHQPLRSPGVFWMQHMNSADAGGRFDVAGFSFVGTPTVQLGHNRHVAWTATTSYPDISDVWEVRANAASVNVGGEQVTLETHEEVIEVRGGEPVTFTVEEVPGHGVLLPEGILPVPVAGAGRRLLFNWVGFRATQEAHSFLGFDTAASLEEWETAVDGMEIGCFNFIAASADGISYRSSMLVPDRGPGATERQHWTMLDGDDPETYWSDAFLSPDLLPRSRGEARGFLLSANNDPYGFVADGTTEGDPFYFGVFFDPGTRAARIEAELTRLTERGAVTPEDMEALQGDTHSVIADRLLPVVEEAWAAVPTDDALAPYRDREDLETLATLLTTDWDRRMDRDSAGALAFDVFTFMVTREALADDFTLLFETILGEEPIFMVKWAALALRGELAASGDVLQEGRDPIVLAALDATATFLTNRFGGVDPAGYAWGDHHGTLFRGLFDGAEAIGWIPTDGGLGTVDKSPASLFADDGTAVERLESTGGPVYRMVTGFGEDGVPQARFNVASGASGDPSSEHFDDTTEDWVEGRYEPLRFTRADVEADATESLTLEPASADGG
ncbi:MAG TPA: penicillin acylase family protein [Sandaracinaceae bacterium LLY-WYZ-13_1]|nr:penicillin acylase family protein [Sandaracinaceae bacterium LLY-WYZ-13_1]